MNIISGLLLLINIFILTVQVGAEEIAADKPFVVHEWGVMMIQDDGILGPAQELIAGLPEFVIKHDQHYYPSKHARAWAKPVIHFYGQVSGDKVQVSIDLPIERGSKFSSILAQPLVYWPVPILTEEIVWNMGDGVKVASKMTWDGVLIDGVPDDMPQVLPHSWWQDIRKIPSRYIQTKNGSERFIFYEATADQEPTVRTDIDMDSITITNTHKAGSGPVLILMNDQGIHYVLRLDNIAAHSSERIEKREFLKSLATEAEVFAACRQQWQDHGMSAAEAQSIVNVWRDDLLHRTGFIIISRLPRLLYDKIFPITITPKPDALVRVGFIFDELPGADARLSWLPQTSQKIPEQFRLLQAENGTVRHQAAAWIRALGDVIHPYLEQTPGIVRIYNQLFLIEEKKGNGTRQKYISKVKNRTNEERMSDERTKKMVEEIIRAENELLEEASRKSETTPEF